MYQKVEKRERKLAKARLDAVGGQPSLLQSFRERTQDAPRAAARPRRGQKKIGLFVFSLKVYVYSILGGDQIYLRVVGDENAMTENMWREGGVGREGWDKKNF